MPLIEPFKGLRYDTRRIGSLSKVVTPPYDVISPEDQATYYSRHPRNFIRVVFGKGYAADTLERNPYSRARNTLEQWVQDGTLKQDPEPSVYPYLQEYTLSGRCYRRWGVVALVRLNSPRIFPHEQIRERPMQDRLRLLETVGASLSPIFGLIPDEKGGYERFIRQICRRRRPAAVAHLEGVKHSLWRVSDPTWIKQFKTDLRSKELVIADGHHRYAAAVAYRDFQKKNDLHYSPRAPYNFAMFYLAAAGKQEPGLLPTHRVLRRFPQRRIRQLLQGAATQCTVQPTRGIKDLTARLQRLQAQGRLGIGFYAGNGGHLLEARPGSCYRLDVEWLHQEILPQWIGPDVEIVYTQDLITASRQVRGKKAQALFVVQPPPLTEVLDRARAALRMPGKTTYFHPKPLAGLVEYKFGGC